jgi:cyanophycin synthetase
MSKDFQIILDEARELNLNIEIPPLGKQIAIISDGKTEIIINELFHIENNQYSEGYKLSKNKSLTYYLWEKNNIPFPRSTYFQNAEEASKSLDKIKFPLVAKENRGSRSINVFSNIKTREELFDILPNFKKGIVVQEMIFGKEYRILVYGDRILGCLKMTPPLVIGNGTNSIRNLVEQKNSTLRKKIVLSEKVISTIKKEGYSLDSILPKNITVFLQNNSCLAEGGTSTDCTEFVHSSIKELALKATRLVNLKLAGIDLICEDISLPASEQNISFLEINGHPSIDIHYFPSSGEKRVVAKDILCDIFKIPQ